MTHRIRLLLLVGSALFAGCATSTKSPAPGGGFIAVMAAFGPELAANAAALLGTNTPVAVTHINGVTFQQVRFAGHDLLLFATGMSTVNAAMTTQLALDRFPVTHVLFAGIAGGINPAHQIGDVVIPERWYHHSEAVYANPRPDGSGYLLPEYFRATYENFGFIFPAHVTAVRTGMDEPAQQPFFTADPGLLAAARRAVAHVPPLRVAGRTASVTVGGAGISGPVFLDNRAYREWAFRVWQADCVDMESTAIGQVCWANRTPFLIVRGLSDLAGGQEGINEIATTEVPVSRHAALVLREILLALPVEQGGRVAGPSPLERDDQSAR